MRGRSSWRLRSRPNFARLLGPWRLRMGVPGMRLSMRLPQAPLARLLTLLVLLFLSVGPHPRWLRTSISCQVAEAAPEPEPGPGVTWVAVEPGMVGMTAADGERFRVWLGAVLEERRSLRLANKARQEEVAALRVAVETSSAAARRALEACRVAPTPASEAGGGGSFLLDALGSPIFWGVVAVAVAGGVAVGWELRP